MDETIRKLEGWNVRVQQGPADTSFAEVRDSDIDGNLIDLSVHGIWTTGRWRKTKTIEAPLSHQRSR